MPDPVTTDVDAPEPAEAPLWRRVLPFALAAALVGFVLLRIDLAAFVRAIRSTHYIAFLAFTLAFNVAMLSADALATTWVYRRTVCPVKISEFMIVRGASYLPAIINHHVGQGWVTYFVSKVYGAPLWRVAGATLFVYVTTFAGVVLLGVAAVPFARDQVPWLLPVVGAVSVAGVLYMIVIALRPRFLLDRQATAPLVELGVGGHLLGVLVRLPHVLVQFLGAWLPFWFFDVHVPLFAALVYVPVLLLVVTLPLTPVGVGTRDVLAVQFFAQYATGTQSSAAAAVAASTLSWAAGLILVQGLGSPILMRLADRMLRERGAAPRPSG